MLGGSEYIATANDRMIGRDDVVAMTYRMNILQALKEKGYNTNRLRKEKLIAEASIQSLRERKPISWANIEKLCALLECKPGDLLDYVPDTAADADTPIKED